MAIIGVEGKKLMFYNNANSIYIQYIENYNHQKVFKLQTAHIIP